MNRIFISYKRADKDLVFPLKDKIEAATGERCWIDLEGIESDAQFANIIMRAIDQADLFLFMFSQNHAKIENFETDWTVREISYAQNKKKRIVIVNLDQTPMGDWFNFMFGLKQRVDATDEQALERMLQDICKWLNIPYRKPEPKPAPQPEPVVEKVVEKVVEEKVVYVSQDKTYVPLGVSIVRCFRQYTLLRGRASRSEFWWWILFRWVLSMTAFTIYGYDYCDDAWLGVYCVLWLFLLPPTVSVWVRRLHDTNHSGWWILCPVYDLVLALMESTPGANSYGEPVSADISHESSLWQQLQRRWIPILTGVLSAFMLVLFVMAMGRENPPVEEVNYELVEETLPLRYDLYFEGTMVDPAELVYNAASQSGEYYVDRKGRRVTRIIRLREYNEQTRELSFEAFTDSAYTGVFEGTLTISGTHAMYSGVFTNASGNSVNFNLTGTATSTSTSSDPAPAE